MKKENTEDQHVTTNRQARRDYFILESLEVGIALKGAEVKSLREAHADFRGSFARIEGNEVFLHNLYITPYDKATHEKAVPDRVRKLLLHKRQIMRLAGQTQQKGLTLVPLKMYFTKTGIAKIELGLGKGKNLYDKRTDIKKAVTGREMDRAIKNRNRN